MYKWITRLHTCTTVTACIPTFTSTSRTFTRSRITWFVETVASFGTVISKLSWFACYKL